MIDMIFIPIVFVGCGESSFLKCMGEVKMFYSVKCYYRLYSNNTNVPACPKYSRNKNLAHPRTLALSFRNYKPINVVFFKKGVDKFVLNSISL